MANRFAVRGKNLIAPRKRHRERQHRGSGHMEVRDHRVSQLEAKARMNKEPAETLDVAGDRPRLERARRAGANRNYTAADSPRMFDGSLGRCRNRVPLGLHRVTLDLDGSHRSESAGTDMQRHRSGADARIGQRLEDLGGEMQPRGGRRESAGPRGIHGLVVVDVGGTDAAMNIVRQRERAGALEYLFDGNSALAYDDWAARPRVAGDPQRMTVAQNEARVILEHAMRPYQRDPFAGGTLERLDRPHHQQLDAAARFLLREQARRQHAGVVEYQQVSFAQMTDEFVKAGMLRSEEHTSELQ